MTAKRKRGPSATEAEKRAWSLAVSLITNSSGFHHGKLECIFKVGDGSGRVWRSWLSGKRLGRDFRRRTILSQATSWNWLTPSDRQLLDLMSLPDAEVFSIPGAPDLPFPVPEFEVFESNPFLRTSARFAASSLLHDALYGPDRWRRWHMAYLKDEGADWRRATEETRKLLATEDEKIVHARLIAAYRNQGYR